MRKFFLAVAALAMLATSCTKDETAPMGNESLVSFSIDSPELMTRAEDGKGQSTNHLQYAFYDENGVILPALSGEVANFVGSTKINISLVEGREYSALFWADNTAAPYQVDLAGKTMTIIENEFDGNADKYDAFYKYQTEINPAQKTHHIELTRPFAQVNIATADKAAAANAGFDAVATQVTVRAHSTLNLATGVVGDNDYVDYTYTWATLPTDPATATVGVKSYEMLSMNYVLVNGRELVNVKMEVSEDATGTAPIERTYTTVPVQRNYRTYIVGNLLTTQNEFNVTTVPGFSGTEEYVVWDGVTATEPELTTDPTTGKEVYTVDSGSDLAWLAGIVNGTITRAGNGDSLEGVTITITKDVDLGGHEWTPIGSDSNHFKGTFDGNNHIISNFKITTRPNSTRAALFGTVSGTVTFRNLTIQNASIECPDFDNDFYGAGLIGTFYGKVTIENVHVKDSYISGNNKVGALAAHDGVSSALKINNCSAVGVTFEASNTVDGGLVGGLVGFFQGAAKGEYYVKNSYVKNCNFNVVNSTNSGKRANAQLIGGISSKANQTLVIENCEVADNTWSEEFYANGVKVTDDTFKPLCGAYVGGERNGSLAGELIVNGVEYVFRNGEYLYTGAIVDAGGVKAIVFDAKNAKAVSVAELSLNGKNWQDAMDWATGLGYGWQLASIDELDAIHATRFILNDALAADSAENALFEEDEYFDTSKYALYMSSTEAVGNDPQGEAYFANRVHLKYFNLNGYWDYPLSTFATISKYAPLKDNYFARGVIDLDAVVNIGDIVTVGANKGIVFDVTKDGVKLVSIEQGPEMTWDEAMSWANGLGEGWALASVEELQAIHAVRVTLNDALEADSAENVLFEEDHKEDDGTYAAYWSSTLVEGSTTASSKAYYIYFDTEGRVMTSFTMFPVEYSRAVYTIK